MLPLRRTASDAFDDESGESAAAAAAAVAVEVSVEAVAEVAAAAVAAEAAAEAESSSSSSDDDANDANTDAQPRPSKRARRLARDVPTDRFVLELYAAPPVPGDDFVFRLYVPLFERILGIPVQAFLMVKDRHDRYTAAIRMCDKLKPTEFARLFTAEAYNAHVSPCARIAPNSISVFGNSGARDTQKLQETHRGIQLAVTRASTCWEKVQAWPRYEAWGVGDNWALGEAPPNHALLQAALDARVAEISELKWQLRSANGTITHLETLNKISNGRVETLKGHVEMLTETETMMEARLAARKRESAALKEQLAAQNREIDALKARLRDGEQLQCVRDDVERERQELAHLRAETAGARAELQRLEVERYLTARQCAADQAATAQLKAEAAAAELRAEVDLLSAAALRDERAMTSGGGC